MRGSEASQFQDRSACRYLYIAESQIRRSSISQEEPELCIFDKDLLKRKLCETNFHSAIVSFSFRCKLYMWPSRAPWRHVTRNTFSEATPCISTGSPVDGSKHARNRACMASLLVIPAIQIEKNYRENIRIRGL